MNDTMIVTRRRVLALLVGAPLALVALPAALEVAPAAAAGRHATGAAWDAILDETRGLADLARRVDGRTFSNAWLSGLLGVAAARDAYVAEHGAWARPIWDGVVDEFLRLMRRLVDEAKARHVTEPA